MTNEKHFPKTMSQWEFDYGLFTNLPKIVKFTDFSPSSLKLKRGIIPLLKNMYCNSETTCHIKLKLFLWTKLLKNLLIAKCLISVVAPLSLVKKVRRNFFLQYMKKSSCYVKEIVRSSEVVQSDSSQYLIFYGTTLIFKRIFLDLCF